MTAMISLDIKGDDVLLRGLKAIADRGRRRELMDRIGAYGEQSTRERFDNQAGPDGERWLQSERAKRDEGGTLIDEGNLLNSLTRHSDADSVEWGTNRVYAGIHQFGGEIKPKNGKFLRFKGIDGYVTAKKVDMPARPYLGVNDTDREEISTIVNDYIAGAFQ